MGISTAVGGLVQINANATVGNALLGSIRGATGETGATGAIGQQGLRGANGTNGTDGLPPAHEWLETSLRFENPDGTWGEFVDLKGNVGEGSSEDKTTECVAIENTKFEAEALIDAIYFWEFRLLGANDDGITDFLNTVSFQEKIQAVICQAKKMLERLGFSNEWVEKYLPSNIVANQKTLNAVMPLLHLLFSGYMRGKTERHVWDMQTLNFTQFESTLQIKSSIWSAVRLNIQGGNRSIFTRPSGRPNVEWEEHPDLLGSLLFNANLTITKDALSNILLVEGKVNTPTTMSGIYDITCRVENVSWWNSDIELSPVIDPIVVITSKQTGSLF